MNIVMLDDERISLAVLKNHVGKLEDTRGHAFTHPTDALAWCESNEADVVIVDFLMHDMDGLEFVQRLRRLPGKEEIPILMVTGSRDRVLRHRALESGINDFLTKPVDVIELRARLKNMIALRASQKKLIQRARQLAVEAFKSSQAAADVAAREHEALMCLSLAAERRQPETHEHFVRLSLYSKIIGLRLGLTEEEAELLRLAAPLHDVGKLGIPDHILLKNGKLTDAEWGTMKQHTLMGAEILGHGGSAILRAGAQIAVSHHEKFDGSGYPYGLKGESIPLFARIVAVADVFDALTSTKPYKPAWDVPRALAVIRDSSGTQFDPLCVHAFFEAIDEILAVRAQHADPAPTAAAA
ncbi:MAG TPA: HD domain-containing phosphohydrolase [Burkholderiales bacterium]|nr:HD domain-containing phosphohydrolase [Burkholderiales bacterium]